MLEFPSTTKFDPFHPVKKLKHHYRLKIFNVGIELINKIILIIKLKKVK